MLMTSRICEISSADLEDVLTSHPTILDAAVTGDEEVGDIPAAFVAIKQDAEASKSSIIDLVAKQVGKWVKAGVFNAWRLEGTALEGPFPTSYAALTNHLIVMAGRLVGVLDHKISQ